MKFNGKTLAGTRWSKPARAFATLIVVNATVAGLVAAMASQASAQSTCNTFINIGVAPPGVVDVGGTKTITLDVGAGGIQGGTQVTINRLKYDLDCDGDFALGIPCTDQGDVFRYVGDISITSTCAGISWTSNLPAGGDVPNEIVFTASPGVVIPAGVNPFCSLSFDVMLDNPGLDTDVTPLKVEVVAGFSPLTMDAVCDNGLSSGGSQSGQIDVPAPTPTPTNTATDTPTDTPTPTPTDTPTDTPTNTPTNTDTPTNTPTNTNTPEDTPTNTPTNTDTPTNTPTNTNTPTDTPTNTPTATNTSTNTPTNTPAVEEICRTKGFWGAHSCPQTAGLTSVCEKTGSQNITQQVINAAGGSILVCGETLTDTHLDHQHSAQEALCVAPRGTQLLQLASQLTAAALNCVISGETAACTGSSAQPEFGACNTACAQGNTTAMVGGNTIDCIDAIDCFNNGGSFDTTTGFCTLGTCANGDACNEETPCTDLSQCTPLPNNCHDQELCNEDLGLCFDPPGPAGSSKQCNAANQNDCTIFSGSPPCAQ
jgi:hypothetical protein